MARINVTVPDEQKQWLDEQPHLTASGLLQKAIEEEQTKEHTMQLLPDEDSIGKIMCSCGAPVYKDGVWGYCKETDYPVGLMETVKG